MRERDLDRDVYCMFYSAIAGDLDLESADSQAAGEKGREKGKIRHVRRQSVSMPELWPHMQDRGRIGLKGGVGEGGGGG